MKQIEIVKAYAAQEQAQIAENELMRPEYKAAGIAVIGNAIRAYSKGLITMSEAMQIIAAPFKAICPAE